jgi:cytochrome c5
MRGRAIKDQDANMKEADPHTSPIKSPKQLIVVVVLAFVVPILLIVLLSQMVTGVRHGADESDARILSRIQPVGTVALTDANAPKGNLSGDAVYGQVCKTCHEAGLAGAPKIGDKGAWSARLAQGQATVVGHAIAGFQGKTGAMPAKGGNSDLTDTEVERAVVYLANQAGATWKEPAAAAVPAPATAAVTPPATPAKSDGKKVFDTACTACHGAGIAGAPKFGDKAAWAPRIAQGINTLDTHALQGFQGKAGVMPPKGGYTSLSDADVKAAVDYMVSAAK